MPPSASSWSNCLSAGTGSASVRPSGTEPTGPTPQVAGERLPADPVPRSHREPPTIRCNGTEPWHAPSEETASQLRLPRGQDPPVHDDPPQRRPGATAAHLERQPGGLPREPGRGALDPVERP